ADRGRYSAWRCEQGASKARLAAQDEVRHVGGRHGGSGYGCGGRRAETSQPPGLNVAGRFVRCRIASRGGLPRRPICRCHNFNSGPWRLCWSAYASLRGWSTAAANGDTTMIGVGIVGCNYGRTVLIPAFRQDPRCEVVALAGTDAARTAELARAANVTRGVGSWQAMVEEPAVAVIAVAVPPDLQPAIAQRALELGKPSSLENPPPPVLPARQPSSKSPPKTDRPTTSDFNFPELPAWQRAKAILDDGAIGRLRNVVVTWNFANRATRLRLESWKTRNEGGGGLLGNFVSHCFYNLEWLCGPISGLTARLF